MSIDPIPQRAQAAAKIVVDAAIRVHRALGPGPIESIYEQCLCHELDKRGVRFSRQVVLPVMYDGVRMESALRLDLVVDDELIVEIKAVEQTLPIHQAQLLTYLKLAQKRLGLLINFNVPTLKDGIKRIAL